YVGYDDNNNTLTERVRRNPYAIVLLDEIEKADPQIITLLLQVLDDGRLTDGQGNTINFKNTVIIATSNAGFGQQDTETSESNIMDRIAPYFRPEFLNRFNSIIKFNHLQKESLEEIVDLMLAEVNQTTAKKGISLTITDDAKAHLIDLGYNHAMGARPLRRIIEQEIRDRITDYYLDHPEVKKLQAILKEGQLVIRQNDQ
ncbi:TPA: AAA family ATPase, partial [Streptococcus pyogenes]